MWRLLIILITIYLWFRTNLLWFITDIHHGYLLCLNNSKSDIIQDKQLSIIYNYTFGTCCHFSSFYHTLRLFPRLPHVASFSGLTTRCKFSCACHTLRLFPRLPRVTSFPALATRCKFSRACHMLQGFRALAACCKYRCMICHDLASVDSRFWRTIPPPPAHSTITTIYDI